MFTLVMIAAVIAATLGLGVLLTSRKTPHDPTMCAANSWNTATEGYHETSLQYKADAAIARYLLVKIGSDAYHSAVAGAADKIIGVTDDEADAAEDQLTILLLNGGRTYMLTASEAITAGQSVFAAASGKIAATSGTQFIGVAKTSASGDGVVCEVVAGRPATQCRTLAFPINLASITTAQDVVTGFTMPTGGIIRNVKFVVNVPVTTGSKLASLNLEIGTTNLTGGVVALTSANCTPMGAIVEDTAITAANVFATGDTISVEAASVTAFSEGSGTLYVEYTELA